MVRETAILKNKDLLIEYARQRFGVSMSDKDAEKVVDQFLEIRDTRKWGWACRDETSAGHLVWLCKRLCEFGYFQVPHVDPTDIRLFTELHFWPWDGGEWLSDSASDVPDWPVTTRRSPLSRVVDSGPINRVARRIAGNGDKSCPYCNRYYRNPAAMSLHLLESHGQELNRQTR